ncbi:TPA: hypothetical protein MHM06_14365 [Klebsiella pneumoniae]|nr:hypothetical protein [Klebsiella pneumoniae]
MGEISVKTGNNARNGGKNSLNRLIRCVCGKKIGPDPRNFNQRVSLGRNDLLIRTFPNETWGEGLSMFHNPNAKHPVPEALFPSIAHHYYDNGQIVSHLPEFHPYSSMTINMKIEA